MSKPHDSKIKYLEEKSYEIRHLALEMITYGQVGHPGGSLSEAEQLACLYFSEMNHDPKNPNSEDRDKFIMSKAHGCPGQYAALAISGYFPIEECYTYGRIDSRLQSHPDCRKTPGIEISGGSLGQGLSAAVGMAIAMRHFKKWRQVVYCMIGDGECDSGQIWEAAMSAAHFHCDNLIALIDYNKVQAKGFVWDMMGVEPLAEKWRAFGWEVQEVDGHDVGALLEALHIARYIQVRGRPSLIIAHTIKGKGVSWMEFNSRWHTHAPLPKESDDALRELSARYEKNEDGYSKFGTDDETMSAASDLPITDKPS